MPVHFDLVLDLAWTPASETDRCRYEMTLTNRGSAALERFTLAFCGPARVDDKLPMENGVILKRLSNYTEVAMPGDGVLRPGTSWTFTFRGMGSNFRIRHWTDAAQTAFVTLADGHRQPVSVAHCISSEAGPGTPLLAFDTAGDPAAIEHGLAIVPWPAHVAVSGARPVGALQPVAGAPGSAEAIDAFQQVTERLFPQERFIGAGLRVAFRADADMGAEAYAISFADTVTVTAAGQTGFFYGLITLGQILRAARMAPDLCRFPAAGEIRDEPRFAWRGSHIDLARQWYTIDEVQTFAAICAWHKLNRLHLHLTEDEAWRYEVTAYPELVRVGAVRGAGLPLPPLLGSGLAPYGGFYTKAELKDLVALADSYGITTVPEVDVPGHSYAAIVALPQLRDPGENQEYRSIQGFPNNCLNSALPETMDFIRTVFAELMEIFPGRWIHVGADEVPDDAWAGSPAAQQRLARIGGGVHEMQADFLKVLHEQIRAAGRITGAWEEGAHGGGITPDASYLVAWRNAQIGSELAAKGYDVVMSPGQAYYLDMARGTDWWEPGATWAGVSSDRHTYEFDPLEGFAPEHRHRMIGIQACIWSEPMSDRRVFQRLVFPRLAAIAETAWTADDRRSYDRFSATARFLPRMYEDS